MNQPTVPSRSSSAERSGKSGSKGKGNGNGAGKRPRKGKKKLALVWLFFIVLIAIVCAVVGYLLVILNGERILNANINKLNLDKASIVVDRNGTEVAKLYNAEGNREFAPISTIPKVVQDAFVATEDKRFYEHNGVDLLGIGRALVKDVIARSAVEGASTITQQLAKNLFLNADKTIFRKGTEASIALALEQKMTKPEILELYLNRIYFGKGQYGVKTAAKYYFDVDDLEELELWQIATLAGMPKAPNTYNPIRNPEKSMERRSVVLKLMYDQGLITEKEKEAAAKEVYKPSKASQVDDKYLAFLDYVLDEAQEKTNLTEEELRSAGYIITTTLDTKAQTIAEKEFANAERFEKSVDEQIVQGAMVIMNQHDGSLVAMVGGRDYKAQGWNRAVKQRQPGSSFKPIIDYGPALETGNYFPWSTVQDVKQCFGDYCPSNSNRNQYLGAIPMSQAIKESRNVSAVWLLNEIGIGKGLEFANRLGIELGKEDRNLSIALGGLTHGVTPLQMARAYSAFANGGKLYEPHSVLKIEDVNGKSIYEFNEKPEQVMKETTAHYVTELLSGVVQKGGTGTRAAISGRTVVGKTGTTQAGIPNLRTSKNRDVWFVGYTPELTASVWFGYDKTDKDHLLDGSSGQAASMFSAVMSKVLEGYKKKSFPVPSGVQEEEEQKLDAVSGLMVSYSPETVSVDLLWTAVPGEEITYRIYRKEAAEQEFKMMAEVEGTTYDDMALLPDQTYTYYVTAYQASKSLESEPSEQQTITVTSGMETTPPTGEEGEETIPPVETGEPTETTEPPIEVPGESPSQTPTPSEGVPPPETSESPSPDIPVTEGDDGTVPLVGTFPQ
ncbi:transglycosylase domain-containing protein [Cohnella phaseoli]|uniref:Penicillin-binding protein 2A n=1 Tax=Cohnella phaseoli TaxID=456490 RepID=A0A3D9JTR7_9BACL|nr:PBP1A family penicillin-binding protein [Cohnella phaseoli]RED77462.1 penicillin-binding protein 2A [Cohnella phaseoli]